MAKDPRKADAMIARLSDLLQRTIDDSGAQAAVLKARSRNARALSRRDAPALRR